MSADYFRELYRKYRTRGILLDANLLLLLEIGRYSPALIAAFKRTSHYSELDYERVARCIARFRVVVTTPSILTEVSNLGGQLPDDTRLAFYRHLGRTVQVLQEEYVISAEVVLERGFQRLGLTDAGIMAASRGRYLVLTDDEQLHIELGRQQIDSIVLSHLRKSHRGFA